MLDIVKKLRETPDFQALSGASLESIKKAEEELTLKFAEEYIEYLTAFGVASAGGHEFTGICSFPRLDVVSNTLTEKNNNSKIPENLYVVEIVNMDDIVIWQSDTGAVYQSAPNISPVKLCNSLCEYIEL
jgi:hypothetical protein